MSQARRLRRQLAKSAVRHAIESVARGPVVMAGLKGAMTESAAVANLRAVAGPAPSVPPAIPATARKLSKLSDRLEIVGEIDKKSAAKVREALAALGGKKDVSLFLNSEGGSCVQGIEMYHAIRRHEGKVVATVDGLAASMASVILQAANERHVSRGSYVMIHNPSAPAEGEAGDLRHTADVLDKIRSDMLDIYEASTGLDRDKIAKMMDDETYLTADEAVKLGFADVVDETEARIDVKAVARLSEKSKKVPEALRAKAAAQAKGQSTMTDEEEKEMKALKEENAKLKAAAAKAEEDDGDSDSDDEEETSAEGDDTPHDEEDDDDKKEAKGVLRAAMRLTGAKSASEAEGKLMALAAGVVSARATEVDGLIKAGKLAPKDKAWAMKASDKAFAAYKNAIGDKAVLSLGKVRTGKRPDDASDASELTAEEQVFMKATGKSKDEIIKSRALSTLEKVN